MSASVHHKVGVTIGNRVKSCPRRSAFDKGVNLGYHKSRMSDIKFILRPESLTVRGVFERNQYSFPVLLQVTQGHHGDIDLDTYSTGHIMRIHTYSKQRRVVAKDNQGRQFSIPVNYKIKFRLSKNSKKGKECTLTEIVENNTLPVKVELCTPPPGYSLHIGQNIKNFESFGELNLLETYDETYLLANSIVEGSMDSEVLFVPIYLKSIVVSMICGMEGCSESEYMTFLEHLNRSADAIHFDTHGGNDDIAVYSSSSVSMGSDNVYDYIQPQHFIKYRETYNRRPSIPKLLNIKEITDKFEARPKVLPKPAKAYNIYSNDPTTHEDEAPPIPKRRAVPKPTENAPTRHDTTGHHYVNNLVRAMVKPLAKATESASGNRPSSAEDVGSSTCFAKGLSINQLADRLESLNLGKYIQTFKDAQISGDLLLDLNQAVLKEDFEMKTFEAIKLMKYARTGYVPK
ncbi:hypothetical protein LOTGIDRAFT_171851 [Lottia gigantea]|uniref:SAM domain-containing protein n=1 Tax=Lottia gigantea TaxID=225164 RepID=V4B562_LOTGI|nr:hypothetical protein LOTGIDRAFT_171851 [Lottia gigantea]ESP02651.1 hypothetical protein LOTGIDRAFT_171851 [Lottia gigantea]